MGQLTVGELEPGTVFYADGMVYMVAQREKDGRVEVMILGKMLERDTLHYTTLASDAVIDFAVSQEPA